MTRQVDQTEPTISLEQVLAHGSVPTLPVVAMRLLELTSNPDVSLKEIAGLIQSDPGLASKVLKTVNSSFYGLPKPCPSIERAIVILGLKAIKSLVLGFSMVNLTRAMDKELDLSDFWKHTILSAVGARQVAQDIGFAEPDEVFAAALMQDIGVLAMLAINPEVYAPLLSETKNAHARLRSLEQQRLGIDHVEVGTALAQKWRMPDSIIAGIRHHHDNMPPKDQHEMLIKCVVAGELATNAMTESFIGQGYAVLFSTVNAWFGQGEQDIEQLFDRIQQSSKEVAKLLDQQIGEVPSAQELMNRASERLCENQLQVQREADLAKQDAMTDALTGVPNRAHFDQLIRREMTKALKEASPIAVLFCDADKFKFVNDSYGHTCGDAVLVMLAKRIKQSVGERGSVCRYGGEEFVILLPGADMAQAAAIAEEIRREVGDRPFDLTGVPGAPSMPLPRTVSIGVAAWQAGYADLTVEQLVQRADQAVYAAKDAGRNNVKRWGLDTGQRFDDPRQIEKANAAMQMPAANEQGKFQILLIEDDPLAARLIQSMLQKQPGVHVDLKTDGRSAIEYLRDCQSPGRRNPDLVLTDINIPGYNGLQIIRALRSNAKFQQIPVVVLTATIDEVLRRSCLDAGASNVYDKLEISENLKEWCCDLIRSMSKAA